MLYADQRTPVVWGVGDLIVTTMEARYLMIKNDIFNTPKYSMMNLSDCSVVMTRDSIAQLRIDFELLYPTLEVVKGTDVMIVSTDL